MQEINSLNATLDCALRDARVARGLQQTKNQRQITPEQYLSSILYTFTNENPQKK
jgi:hypothetical protein